MDELGALLQETRKALGLTLEDVASGTRIRLRFLRALEAGRYDELPSPVHVRGFLRNYAGFLKIDSDPLIERYNASQNLVQDIAPADQVRPEVDRKVVPLPETLDEETDEDAVFFRPIGSSLNAPAWFSADLFLGGFIILVMISFIVWAGVRFLGPAIDKSRSADETVTVEAVTPEITVVPSEEHVSGATTETEPATSEATSPPIYSSILLEVTVLERSWVTAIVDGTIVFEAMAAEGDVFTWEGTQIVKLSTGNAAGLQVLMNGQDLGPLGARGELVERIWTLSGEIEATPTPTLLPTEPPTETPTPDLTATAAVTVTSEATTTP